MDELNKMNFQFQLLFFYEVSIHTSITGTLVVVGRAWVVVVGPGV